MEDASPSDRQSGGLEAANAEEEAWLHDALEPRVTSTDLDWWFNLSEEMRWLFIRVTEQLHIDRTAGLMQLADRLRLSRPRILRFLLLQCRICLNVYNISTMFFIVWSADVVAFANDESTVLEESTAYYCSDGMQIASHRGRGWDADVSARCISVHARFLDVCRVVSLCECFIVGSLCFGFCYASVIFLCCGECGKRLPRTKPFWFIVAPGFAATQSGLAFLQYISMSRVSSLVIRGEGKLFSHLILDALCCPVVTARRSEEEMKALFGRANSEGFPRPRSPHPQAAAPTWHKRLKAAGYVLLVLAGLALSCAALLVKFVTLHFVTVQSPLEWTWRHWLMVLGFLNQLGGICHSEHIELHRLLLFKFAGSDSIWNGNECITTVAFFHLLALKVVGIHRVRLHSLVMLSTLTSDDMQVLFMSPRLKRDLRKARRERLRIYSAIYPNDASTENFEATGLHSREGLAEDLARHMAEAKQFRDMLQRMETYASRAGDSRGSALNCGGCGYTREVSRKGLDGGSRNMPSPTSAVSRSLKERDLMHVAFEKRLRLLLDHRNALLALDASRRHAAWKLRLASEVQEMIEDLVHDADLYDRHFSERGLGPEYDDSKECSKKPSFEFRRQRSDHFYERLGDRLDTQRVQCNESQSLGLAMLHLRRHAETHECGDPVVSPEMLEAFEKHVVESHQMSPDWYRAHHRDVDEESDVASSCS